MQHKNDTYSVNTRHVIEQNYSTQQHNSCHYHKCQLLHRLCISHKC